MLRAARLSALFSAAALAQREQGFVADVTSFGAKGDGVTRDEAAISAAVAAVAAHGGGTLLFPPGTYLTSPVNLTSDCTLLLRNATLLAAAEFGAWRIVAPLPSYGRGRDFPGPRYEAFLGVHNLSRVRITGEGGADANFINGQGASWWAALTNGSLRLTPGHLIETTWAADVEVDGITLVDSPFWNIHLWSSARLHVHDVKVRAPGRSRNTDGVDPDSSSDVLVERMDVQNGDDCIAIKSGWDAPGVRYGVPSVNVTFRDSVCDSDAGQGNCIAIGSEMSGGVSDVFISNITCKNSGTLIDVKSTLGRGGYVRNVHLRGAVITGAVKAALQISDLYGDNNGPVNKTLVPLLSNIFISDVVATASAVIGAAGVFEGLGATPAQGQIVGVVLTNVSLGAPLFGWTCSNVSGSSTAVLPAPCKELIGGW